MQLLSACGLENPDGGRSFSGWGLGWIGWGQPHSSSACVRLCLYSWSVAYGSWCGFPLSCLRDDWARPHPHSHMHPNQVTTVRTHAPNTPDLLHKEEITPWPAPIASTLGILVQTVGFLHWCNACDGLIKYVGACVSACGWVRELGVEHSLSSHVCGH